MPLCVGKMYEPLEGGFGTGVCIWSGKGKVEPDSAKVISVLSFSGLGVGVLTGVCFWPQ